ncbi:unnamed protein product [Adineta steineri]|uniref:Uncharacterized protein n=1 Tax=Adineta steineri TaxID=433720 RepID=A0A816E7D5_9BILA|nr:unnamed protein product [Adineta steineri]CAF1646753.1 unnamed protein product [Adineta steineri]
MYIYSTTATINTTSLTSSSSSSTATTITTITSTPLCSAACCASGTGCIACLDSSNTLVYCSFSDGGYYSGSSCSSDEDGSGGDYYTCSG